eukprot:SM000293S10921  [mRNA]  locus=s293:120523:124023:- [translate_table: standard]
MHRVTSDLVRFPNCEKFEAQTEKETNLAQGAASNAVALNSTHEDDLAAKGSEDGLGVNQAGVAKVVKAARGEDLGASLPPNGLPEGGAALGQKLWGEAAKSAKHGPASMDDLRRPRCTVGVCPLPVPGEGLRVSREARSVPAVVTGVLAIQVRGRRASQRAQEQGAVRAVPAVEDNLTFKDCKD